MFPTVSTESENSLVSARDDTPVSDECRAAKVAVIWLRIRQARLKAIDSDFQLPAGHGLREKKHGEKQ